MLCHLEFETFLYTEKFDAREAIAEYNRSDISAISIRLQYEADKEKGLAVYKKLCGPGGSREYDGAMEALGLSLPYSEQAVRDVKDYLAEKLGLEKQIKS